MANVLIIFNRKKVGKPIKISDSFIEKIQKKIYNDIC